MISPCTSHFLHGHEIAAHVNAVADLRIRVFRQFPYLYQGNPAYEAEYLQTCINSPRSRCLLAWAGPHVVGAATTLPLADKTAESQQSFIDTGWSVERLYYFSESVLLPAYRGQGTSVRFFIEREAQGGLDWCAFCAVQRPAAHSQRPAGYIPLDVFRKRRGFHHRPELRTEYVWRDISDSEETAKPMSFWLKRLGAAVMTRKCA